MCKVAPTSYLIHILSLQHIHKSITGNLKALFIENVNLLLPLLVQKISVAFVQFEQIANNLFYCMMLLLFSG